MLAANRKLTEMAWLCSVGVREKEGDEEMG